MNWPEYIAAFFAGLFFTNFVPHFVHGISGNRFPTPFAKPPGRGLSSPLTNVLWALANLILGYLLFKTGKVFDGDSWAPVVFFAGVALLSIPSSIGFQRKHAS